MTASSRLAHADTFFDRKLRPSAAPSFATLAGAAFIAGCSQASPPTPSTPPQPPPSSPVVDLAPRQGPDFPVGSSRILLGLQEIRLDDARMAWDPASIRDKLTKIEPLFDALHSTGDPVGECVFEIEPAVPFFAAASAISTSTLAGCPEAWVSTGTRWLKLRIPAPLLAPKEFPPSRRQIALHVSSSQYAVEFFSVVPNTDGKVGERLEPMLDRTIARGAQGARELGDALLEGCAGAPRPCPLGMWLTADANILFGDAAGALAAVAEAQKKAAVGAAELLVGFRQHGSVPLERAFSRMDPAEIQRVVRANFNTFRRCYEEGLARDPNLQGLISVRFVIERDGRVQKAEYATSGPDSPAPSRPVMPDQQVVACVLDGFKRLVFPTPEGGSVTVVYPIVFSPAE